MARQKSRLGVVAMVASSVRTAVRPGSPGLGERATAVPRMVSARLRGQYNGFTWGHLGVLAAAVVYIVSPLDLVPEGLFSVFGLADDAVVATLLAAALVNDTEAFLAWERGGSRESRRSAGAPDQRSPGPSPSPSPGPSPSPSPQDAPAHDYRRGTVQSHVVG